MFAMTLTNISKQLNTMGFERKLQNFVTPKEFRAIVNASIKIKGASISKTVKLALDGLRATNSVLNQKCIKAEQILVIKEGLKLVAKNLDVAVSLGSKDYGKVIEAMEELSITTPQELEPFLAEYIFGAE